MELCKRQSLTSVNGWPTRRLKKRKARTESCKWPCGWKTTRPQRRTWKSYIMGDKTRFSTPIDRILANHSGWSGVDCKTCGRVTTKAQLAYSIRFFRKPLCRSCQSLEHYRASTTQQEAQKWERGWYFLSNDYHQLTVLKKVALVCYSNSLWQRQTRMIQ